MKTDLSLIEMKTNAQRFFKGQRPNTIRIIIYCRKTTTKPKLVFLPGLLQNVMVFSSCVIDSRTRSWERGVKIALI